MSLAGWCDAVVFDFDGTIADSESVEHQSWQRIWSDHGHVLELDDWLLCVGTRGGWDPVSGLEARLGRGVDRRSLIDDHHEFCVAAHAGLGPRDGVLDWLDEAVEAGVKVGLASSADHAYLERSLVRLGIRQHFLAVVGYDDVGAAKPDPATYVEACRLLAVAPQSALAIEDSPHGVAAAAAAGLRCVACPGPITAGMDFGAADLRIPSFVACLLTDVASAIGRGHPIA